MSNLIGNLLSNSQALNVQSYALETTGKNLANVNNPDYARQRVTLRDGINYRANGQTHSLGLEALGVEHIRNSILDQQIMNEKMERNKLEEKADLLYNLETQLNEFISSSSNIETLEGSTALETDPGTISKAIDDFFNAFNELAALPDSYQQKILALQEADNLAAEFNLASGRLTEMDDLVGDRIEDHVQEVNDILGSIAQLNKEITRFEAKNGVFAPDLRDERQAALEELAEYIDFDVKENPTRNNMLDVIAKDDSAPPAEVFLVTGDRAETDLYYDEASETIKVETPNGQPDINLTIKEGAIGAALDVKTYSVPQLRAELDALANGIVTTVNAAYDPNNTGRELFESTGISIATMALDASFINAADNSLIPDNLLVTDNAGGGNELALAIGDLISDTSIMNGQSFAEYTSGVAARIGNEASNVQNDLDNQKIIDDYLRTQRESHSGVSIDEEMTDLMRFQRSFQGTSRVINVIDQMLEVVVAGLGR